MDDPLDMPCPTCTHMVSTGMRGPEVLHTIRDMLMPGEGKSPKRYCPTGADMHAVLEEARQRFEDQENPDREIMELVEDLIRRSAKKINALNINWGGMDIDLSKKFIRKPFIELLNEATGHDISELDQEQLKKICSEKDIDIDDNSNLGQILDELMSQLVEPKLIQPTFVIDYPKAISPLAKAHRDGDPNLVERFELFIGGAEFANSFSELNDPIDQRERLEAQAILRDRGDDEAQPVDENFIQAMECGMPPTGGVGIGIDRLTMLLTSNRWIKDVILFPTLRSESS